MSISITPKIPEIGHLQFLILRSFGSEAQKNLGRLRSEQLPDLHPAMFSMVLRRMVDKGQLRKIGKGHYEITRPGAAALEVSLEFYKQFV